MPIDKNFVVRCDKCKRKIHNSYHTEEGVYCKKCLKEVDINYYNITTKHEREFKNKLRREGKTLKQYVEEMNNHADFLRSYTITDDDTKFLFEESNIIKAFKSKEDCKSHFSKENLERFKDIYNAYLYQKRSSEIKEVINTLVDYFNLVNSIKLEYSGE